MIKKLNGYFFTILLPEIATRKNDYVLITNRKTTAYATGHALNQGLPVIDLIVK